MPPKVSHKKTLLGDEDGNLPELLRQVKAELGGTGGMAQYLSQYIKDPNANPYLRNKSFGILTRLMEKVDARGVSEQESLTDEELEEEVMKSSLQFLVPMPDDMFHQLMTQVQSKRDEYATREAKARLARENATRPLGAPANHGIEKSAS